MPSKPHYCRSLSLQNSPDKFLQKRAEPRALLRRQQSSRKLQRFWRALYESRLTTHHLASGFIRTGVPRVTMPAAQAVPPTPSAGSTSALHRAAVSSPIPVPEKRNGGRPFAPAAEVQAVQPPATPDTSPVRQRPAVAILGPRPALLNVEEVHLKTLVLLIIAAA